MLDVHLNCAECPECETRLQTKDSRTTDELGFITTKRRKVCPGCGFQVYSAEVPLSVANDIFGGEE